MKNSISNRQNYLDSDIFFLIRKLGSNINKSPRYIFVQRSHLRQLRESYFLRPIVSFYSRTKAHKPLSGYRKSLDSELKSKWEAIKEIEGTNEHNTKKYTTFLTDCPIMCTVDRLFVRFRNRASPSVYSAGPL